jgi:pyruvate dehydrogenase E2 component (dihydrolipoamide acetyltransferase)
MAEVINMPKLGFDMAEGTLVRWVIAEGETVSKGAVLAEIETDKATVEVQSSADGVVYRHLVETGAVVPVGKPIAIVADPGEKVDESQLPAAANPVEKEAEPLVERPSAALEKPTNTSGQKMPEPEMLRISPIARRMIRENNLSPEGIRGTGPDGRIVKKDIEQLLNQPKGTGQNVSTVPISPYILREIPADEIIPINRLRAAIGKRMIESTQNIPQFYVTHEFDMEALMALRTQINTMLPENEKVSVNDFIIKAVALALRQFPNLNSVLQESSIIHKGHVNVGVAVAVEGGLLTVVVKDADQKPLRLISSEVKEMSGRVRSGKVKPEDIEGSTFSISNLGMFDVEEFVAIINPPESAILAVGTAREMPVVKDGVAQVGMRMKATLSADHRITDGAEAAQFLQALAKRIENPLSMLI